MSQASLDVIRGVAQAAASSFDGALNDKGEPIKIGLKREEGHPVLDSRTVDGFKVRVHGNKLLVTYQSDIKKPIKLVASAMSMMLQFLPRTELKENSRAFYP